MKTRTASSVALDSGVVAGSGRRARDVEAGAVPGPSARADGRDADTAAGATRIDAIDTIDALLPQTQCRRCGYHACRPYAEAMVRGDADINRCPPGGETTVAALAGALGRAVIALDPACGAVGRREMARIDESACIGCAVCIRACPVDAIIGARKWMHVVLESECTGCGLCVEPCPVDCISMVPARTGPATAAAWLAERAPLARRRFERRRARESALEAAPHRRERADRIDAVASLRTRTVKQRRTDIAAAVARVKARAEAAHAGAEDFGAVARVEARTEAAYAGTEDFGAVARTRARAEAAGKAWGGERRS